MYLRFGDGNITDGLLTQDALWSAVLNDEKLLQEYITEAQARAADAYSFVEGWLDRLDIKHGNPVAGHFVWIDLRKYLPTHNEEGQVLQTGKERELEICRHLLEANVFITPGSSYHSPKAGFFRLTFTLRREYLSVGLERAEQVLNKIKGIIVAQAKSVE